MNRITAVSAILIASCLIAAAVQATDDAGTKPTSHNRFAGQIVVVVCSNSQKAAIENASLQEVGGRQTLCGDGITITHGHPAPWSYQRTGGRIYISWSDATVVTAFDLGKFKLDAKSSAANYGG